MKFVNEYNVEAVEIRVPPFRKTFVCMSSGTCQGAILTVGHCYIMYDFSNACLVNEEGIVYRSCTLGECEGDLHIEGHKLKKDQKLRKSKDQSSINTENYHFIIVSSFFRVYQKKEASDAEG